MVDFLINQNYIAKNLCENRDKPQLHCNGKCQLCKKLTQEDNKDKQNPQRRNEERNEVLSSKTWFAKLSLPAVICIKQDFVFKNNNVVIDQSYSFFHPPQYLFL